MATLAPGLRARFGRTGLAPAGLHQEVSPSHLRFLLFHAFPSAITMSALSINAVEYRPGRVATLAEFGERCRVEILTKGKDSSQSADKSPLTRHILPYLVILRLA